MQVLRLKAVMAKTCLSRSTIYRLMNEGKFPHGFKLSDDGRASGWLESEIDAYILRMSQNRTTEV